MEIHYPDAVTVIGGTARGVTLGGNLCLLTSSVGTDTALPARDGILMIEDKKRRTTGSTGCSAARRSGYLGGVTESSGDLH